jgi:Family of unknown function (DUF5681)
MSLRQKDGEVGYKRPPKSTQWKKGQCGNPKRQYKRASKGIVEIIDALFEEQIDIRENGVPRRASVFEAVLLQLWMKEMAGDKRAIAVRLKFQEFVASQGKPGGFILEYPQDDYTRWLAEDLQRDGTKDE